MLKKLAKEDHHSLGFISPNYIIGGQQQQASPSNGVETNSTTNLNGENGMEQSEAASNSCVKQEEILKKFFSGDINLLICTCEMERSIESPTFVNLIVRLNCTTSANCSASSPITSALSTFDYFSYIETKSRAKSKQAYCHFFVEQSHFSKFFARLNRYKQIENLLMNNYSQLVPFNRPILANQSALAINSKLSMENALFFINR